MKYIYFVSCQVVNFGFTCGEVAQDSPITRIEQIQKIADYMSNQFDARVVVMSFQLLRTELI